MIDLTWIYYIIDSLSAGFRWVISNKTVIILFNYIERMSARQTRQMLILQITGTIFRSWLSQVYALLVMIAFTWTLLEDMLYYYVGQIENGPQATLQKGPMQLIVQKCCFREKWQFQFILWGLRCQHYHLFIVLPVIISNFQQSTIPARDFILKQTFAFTFSPFLFCQNIFRGMFSTT